MKRYTQTPTDDLVVRWFQHGGIVAIRCPDVQAEVERARNHMERLGLPPALVVDAPIASGDFLREWCGVGRQPDPVAAPALVDAARSRLRIASTTESLVEHCWRLEASDHDDADTEAAQAAHAILSGNHPDAHDAVRDALDRWDTERLSIVEQFQRLTALMGPRGRPIVVAVSSASLAASLAIITQAVEQTPDARLVAIISAAEWPQLQRSLDPHTVALLQQTMVDVPLNAKPAPEVSAETTTPQLKEQAAKAIERAERATAASVPVQTQLPPECAVARSLAEALLYRALNDDPRTTGLFALNADGGFVFGRRNAEIDLFCTSHRIAIEVDGYFHFVDEQAYRRDRAKDWLMQRQGYCVLRFLAQDVTDRLSDIVALVADAIAWRCPHEAAKEDSKT